MVKALLIGAVAIVALFFLFNSYIYNEKQGDGVPTEPYRGTLSGTHVCLPHKDTNGPQTDECAPGIRTDADEYYALDFNLMSGADPEISINEHFAATGLITPIENLSTNYWQQYDVKGIFSVTDSVSVTSDPSEETPPVAAGKCYIGGCSAQLCTDQPDMASDCMYREEYACYASATCERQTNGQCGWTETPTLRACIEAAGNGTI